MKGETTNIGTFCQFGWYQWVKYYDETAKYPNGKYVLGRYLVPSPGIGSQKTAKILKKNGNYYHTSTFRELTHDEMNNSEELKLQNKFTNGPTPGPGFTASR